LADASDPKSLIPDPESLISDPKSPIPGSRIVLAVIGGMLLFMVVSELLETTLVNAVADRPVADVTAYFAVRNSSTVLGAKVVYNTLAAILAGYMTAKIAGRHEMRYTGITAALQTASLAWGVTMGEYASFTPIWMRWMLVLTTGPAMLLGAAVRAKASAEETEQS
jgi:hypothetical protein